MINWIQAMWWRRPSKYICIMHWQPLHYQFRSMFRIIIMLKYDIRTVETFIHQYHSIVFMAPSWRHTHSWPRATVSSTSLMTQDMLHEVHASLPHSNAHSKDSSRLQHHLVHQLWWLLHMLIIEQGWCLLCALLLKDPHQEHTLYKS